MGWDNLALGWCRPGGFSSMSAAVGFSCAHAIARQLGVVPALPMVLQALCSLVVAHQQLEAPWPHHSSPLAGSCAYPAALISMRACMCGWVGQSSGGTSAARSYLSPEQLLPAQSQHVHRQCPLTPWAASSGSTDQMQSMGCMLPIPDLAYSRYIYYEGWNDTGNIQWMCKLTTRFLIMVIQITIQIKYVPNQLEMEWIITFCWVQNTLIIIYIKTCSLLWSSGTAFQRR